MGIIVKNFFTSVNPKAQKNGKNTPISAKSEAYAKLTVGLRLFYDYLLITQMLKFRQKRDMKHPDFLKNDVYTSFTDVLRWSYGGLTVVLRWSYDSILISQILKFK